MVKLNRPKFSTESRIIRIKVSFKIFLPFSGERAMNLLAINAKISWKYRVEGACIVCTVGQDTNELWSTMWPRYALMNYDVEAAARPEYIHAANDDEIYTVRDDRLHYECVRFVRAPR